MSRQIDTSKRLSEEDRQYLVDRGRIAEVQQNDRDFGRDDSGEPTVIDDGNTGDVDPFTRDDGSDVTSLPNLGPLGITLVQSVEVARKAGLSDEEIEQRVASSLRQAPGSHSDTPDEEDTRDYDKDYEEWSKKDLEREVDERNEGRDEDGKISKSGTKAEIAARLNEDDDNDDSDGSGAQ